ncbi:proline rich transmembrane protein 1B [Melospiza melodia melodia]|uniref:proline rich transmembrane protein 1B n=1 Tax=Melospiza melodia melodia TaxID=1914991 RepID=UPI002FD00BB6
MGRPDPDPLSSPVCLPGSRSLRTPSRRCCGPGWPVRGGAARGPWANSSGSMINRPGCAPAARAGPRGARGPRRGRNGPGPERRRLGARGHRREWGRGWGTGGNTRAAPWHPGPGVTVPGASRPIRASLSPQASPRMDGEPPAGPQARGPAARGPEPGDGSGAAGAPTGTAGALPTPGAPTEALPTPGAPTEALPTPGAPTEALPTPGAPTEAAGALPTPGAPTGTAWAPTGVPAGAAGALPTPGPRSDAPAAPGDRPVAVSVVSNSAFEGAPPPYSPPDPKSYHLLYPPFPAGYAQQGPVIYPPGPGPRPYPGPGFHPGPLPYSPYHPPPGPSPAGRGHHRPKDYTVESVLVTLFCCLITGVMALVYSHETRAALARGDMAQAYLASKKAQSLVLISLLIGLFASISWIVYVLVSLYL